MNRVPDRKRQRREYLRKKRQAYKKAVAAGTLFVPTFMGASVCFLLTAFGFGYAIWNLNATTFNEYWLVGTIPFTGIGAILLWIAKSSWSAIQQQVDIAKHIPYVPPVTPFDLPADEILVRGAQQPDAPQETLLRAAQGDEEVAHSQLLRAAPSATEAQE